MTRAIVTTQPNAFEALAHSTLLSLSSASSQRVYAQTLRAWAAWATDNGLDALDLRPAHVVDFLTSQPTAKSTRQRQLSALRKLASMLYVLTGSDDAKRLHEALKMVKAPAGDGQSRARTALTPSEADKVLRVWNGTDPKARRNRALVAVLALTGMRRSEAAALRWRDVDFTNGVIHIAHGKGDKARDVPLAGDYALDALRQWQLEQGAGREWVFCPVERGAHVGRDKPLSGSDVYDIVKQTEAEAGTAFKPHDLRRTFITEALATGAPIQTVQAIAGHARGETTLGYAQAVDARRARKELRLRYG